MSTEVDAHDEPSSAEPPPEQDAAVPEPAAQPAGLASIIIDPSLLSEPPAPAPEAMPPAPANGGSVPAAAMPAPEPEPINFDAAAADRFAAAFRPSWEGLEPVAPAAPAIGPRSSLPPTPSHKPPVGAAVMSSMAPVDEALAVPVRAARNRAVIWTSALIVGFLVLAYMGVSSSNREPTTKANANRSSNVPRVEAVPAPSHEEAPPPSAASPGAASTVKPLSALVLAHLHVSTQPANAQLELDGNPVDNPFDAQMAQGADHQLKATAPGHATEERSLRLSADTDLTLVLAALPGAHVAPVPEPAAAVPAPEPPQAAPAPARAPAPVVHKAAPVATVRTTPAPKHRAAPAPATTTHTTAKPKAKRGAGFVADSPY